MRHVLVAALAALAAACSGEVRDGDDGLSIGGTANDSSGTTGPTDQDTSSTGHGTDTTTTGDPVADTTGDSDSGTTTATTDDSTSGGSTDTGEPALVYLSIEPPESIVELDLDEAGSVALTVSAHYDNGATLDVTDEVDGWSVGNPAVGVMNGSTLEVGGFGSAFFESTIVTAILGDETGNAQVTAAAYNLSGEQPDFFFVLPYEDPAGSQDQPLEFTTNVKSLDVFFNMDTTVSMSGPINNLQTSLVSTIIPDIEAQIANTWFGAGHFEDFPVPPYGSQACLDPGDPDQPFRLLQEVTNTAALVQAAVNAMSESPGGVPIGCGEDGPESNIEALYQIATGAGLAAPGLTSVAPNSSGVGGVGLREGTMPVIVSITDAVSQDNAPICLGASYTGNVGLASVAHDRDEMHAALQAICARVVPVAIGNFSAACGPLADGTEFATITGAVIPPQAWDELVGGRPAGCAANECCTGLAGTGVPTDGAGLCPLVYRGATDGTGLDGSIVDGVQMLARYARFTVSAEVEGLAQDQ
ncbi:MAG: hypothetical protein JKY37_32655, partial [Nannocystaceae bacterium]|nr:hypothetical protein [Nannocystaceae bacterium]